MGFRISERFRLEVHWQKVIYSQDKIANLEGCYLNGPALKEIDSINQNDHIVLDFINQYIFVIKDYHIATLSWEGADRVSDKIFLFNTILSNKNLNSVPKLNDTDYIVIDTSNHTPDRHQRFLTYTSYLIRFDGDQYDFRR
jgi:hypothetical protein